MSIDNAFPGDAYLLRQKEILERKVTVVSPEKMREQMVVVGLSPDTDNSEYMLPILDSHANEALTSNEIVKVVVDAYNKSVTNHSVPSDKYGILRCILDLYAVSMTDDKEVQMRVRRHIDFLTDAPIAE